MVKKVLELTGEPIGTGGQEMFVVNVIRHIRHEGIVIDWLTPYYIDNKNYENDVVKFGGHAFCLNLPFNPGKSRRNIIAPFNRFLKQHHYDVVHIHSGSISVLVLGSIVARMNGVKKVIVHSHCAGTKKDVKYRILRLFADPLMKFFPTDYCACSELAGEWKFPRFIVNKKMRIMKNGVDLKLFSPSKETRENIRKRYNVEDSTLLLGHVGRFSEQKNQEFAIRILAEIVKRGVSCKLMFIGEGENFEEVIKLVRDLSLQNYVIFVGTVNNVCDYMQAMDVFILPSRWEGLPIVGIEAQAAGLPVFVSDKVTTEMKLVDNVTYLPISDETVWATAILSMKLDRLNNGTLIKNAGYDIDDTANAVREIYMS
jgi:glycosyltransferase involved in cell wall biosynthesis